MPCRLLAEEIELASSTLEIPAECSKIAESKEECLAKVIYEISYKILEKKLSDPNHQFYLIN